MLEYGASFATPALRRFLISNTLNSDWFKLFSKASRETSQQDKSKRIRYSFSYWLSLPQNKVKVPIMGDKSERTLVMVKPDGVQRALVGEIIRRFEQKGFKLVGMKFKKVCVNSRSQLVSKSNHIDIFYSNGRAGQLFELFSRLVIMINLWYN